MTILEQIYAHKQQEVARRKAQVPLRQVQALARLSPPPLDFGEALRQDKRNFNRPALIAEVKRRSPSKGLLARKFDPIRLADAYAFNGAAAISVLTDEHYFGGELEHLRKITGCLPRLPVLQKDFIYDPYQVYEARAAGADAILLIVAGLEQQVLMELHDLALELGMAPLVEVHTEQELERAQELGPCLVGINNRDLRTFEVSLDTCLRLRRYVPPGMLVVAESGIQHAQDVTRLAQAGIDAMLVGKALVSAEDVVAKVREFTRPAAENVVTGALPLAGKIKICGITNVEDALMAIDAGADMLGFIFYPPSPRYISQEVCRAIVGELRARGCPALMVGVFVNTPIGVIQDIMHACDLDLAQLSGDEPVEDLVSLKGCAYKGLRLSRKDNILRIANEYNQNAVQPALLMDTNMPGIYGGSGQLADWRAARLLASRFSLLLAGGLTHRNIGEAIDAVRPWGVDVASGVEASPGRKDPSRLREFIDSARRAYRSINELQYYAVPSGDLDD